MKTTAEFSDVVWVRKYIFRPAVGGLDEILIIFTHTIQEISKVVFKKTCVRNARIYNKLMLYETHALQQAYAANRITLSFIGILHDRVFLKTTAEFSDVVWVRKYIFRPAVGGVSN